jgi:hypothetical protein
MLDINTNTASSTEIKDFMISPIMCFAGAVMDLPQAVIALSFYKGY